MSSATSAASVGEEELFSAEQVRHQKREGTLIITTQRLAFQPLGRDKFENSYHLHNIKNQRISPDTKRKVQLQIHLINDEQSYNFHFVNKAGHAKQLHDRNHMKELLQQLLSTFRKRVNIEFEAKTRLLREDAHVHQLYRDVVESEIIQAEDFWQHYTDKALDDASRNGQQDVGVAPAFLAEIVPQTDTSSTSVKYNLTPDVIQAVFRTYPSVKRKHAECVPNDMSEADFWTRFFQSHYFHRDRPSGSDSSSSAKIDIFRECARIDDESFRREVGRVDDPNVDMRTLDDREAADGYGTSKADETLGGEKADNAPASRGKNTVSKNQLIRRFNQHSAMVLRTTDTRPNRLRAADGSESDLKRNAAEGGAVEASSSKRVRMFNPDEYADLAAKAASDEPPGGAFELNEAVNQRYHACPVRSAAAAAAVSNDQLITRRALVGRACYTSLSMWDNAKTIPIRPIQAPLLNELTQRRASADDSFEPDDIEGFPADLRDAYYAAYRALAEILRHFWSCFPLGKSTSLRQKLERMKEALDKFTSKNLQQLKNALQENGRSLELCNHLVEQIRVARDKFDTVMR